jgi:hypothetical protein
MFIGEEGRLLGVNVQHTSGAAKALVPASEVDCSNAILAQHGSTHDAWLDGDIEICLVEDADGVLGQDASDGDKLGVSGTVQGPICLVHASSNDFAIFDEDTADGRLIALECQFGL